MQKPDTLIRTKLRLPFIRSSLVTRPRLLAKISAGLCGPLTLVIAPAGFGKTTLVASGVSLCRLPAAWLSLDKDDNQIERFLSYVIAGLQMANPAIGSEAAQLLAASQHASPGLILTSLINDIDQANQDFILVLDDYQFIGNPEVHEQMAFLLDHCPSSLHLVIATRSDPPLPLTRLRARSQMVELRTADLRFTGDEAAQFLNEVMGLTLDTSAVSVLADRTEGWIAGLQMAALSMRDREDVPKFIEGFSGTNRYILDYLLEEVLASQPAETQHFLLCTSILERISAPLCDAVLSGENESGGADQRELVIAQSSAQALDYLEKANLFLIALDDERQWYRYHHLFADLLRTQLHKMVGDATVAGYHLRASAWFEQNGSPIEAIQHASFASDYMRIERLIEENYIDMLNRGAMSWIRFWMGKLSKELVYQRPWLCLYEAFSQSWFGQLDEASLLLREAERHFGEEAWSQDLQAMRGYHAYVHSRVTAMQGDNRRAIELCLTARGNIPANNLGLQIEVGITLGYEYFLAGDFTNASQVLGEMIHSCSPVQAINNPVAAYALLARAKVLQGRTQAGYKLYEKAGQLITSAGGQYPAASGLVEAGLAELWRERNDLGTAQACIQHSLEHLPWWGKADDFCLAYVTLARIQLALGQPREAAEAIEKAVQWTQTSGVFSEARSAVDTARVRLWLAQGEETAARSWAEAQGKTLSDRFEDEIRWITLARVYLKGNREAEACRLLRRLEETARAGGRFGRLVEILLLKALAEQGMGERQAASRCLLESLELAETGGFVRTFLDEGQPVRNLLAWWLAQADAGQARDYARHLMSQFEHEPAEVASARDKGPSATGLIEPLSQRELEVLHLMALGKTNQEIATQLIVTRGTVKAHAASIYRKLDAANRTEAVARARQLSILP